MASEYFKRMRNQTRQSRSDVLAPAADAPVNPWNDGTNDLVADLQNSGRTPDERSEAYAEWVQRMQDKRTRNKASIASVSTSTGSWASLGEDPATSANYWTTDALFAESERVAHEEMSVRPNPWRVNELLELLDLRHDATADEISIAYKKLAKAHHPDRYVSADEATQQFHADKMLEVNKAYRTLRQIERV